MASRCSSTRRAASWRRSPGSSCCPVLFGPADGGARPGIAGHRRLDHRRHQSGWRRRNALGAVLGAAIVGVLENGIVLLGINTYAQQVVTGAAILLAVGSISGRSGASVASRDEFGPSKDGAGAQQGVPECHWPVEATTLEEVHIDEHLWQDQRVFTQSAEVRLGSRGRCGSRRELESLVALAQDATPQAAACAEPFDSGLLSTVTMVTDGSPITVAIVPKVSIRSSKTPASARKRKRGTRRHFRVAGAQTGDAALQVKMIEDLITKQVNAIVISPNEPTSVVDVINDGMSKGILMMTFDSDSPDSDRVMYIGTDNKTAGKVQGET